MTDLAPDPQLDPELEALLEYLRRHRGFDFTGYKRSSLSRRIRKQMQTLGLDSFSDYQDYLEVDPQEFACLFNRVLINVTSFFRDPEVWQVLEQQVIPTLLASKTATEPIRVWSAGCASGEEAYSLAMVLAEVLGVEQFRQRVKIYATDLDRVPLEQARQASYTHKAVRALAPRWHRYFEPDCRDQQIFRSDLRRAVIFGCHNLLQDAPISRVDLLVCRNTLIYFNAEAQRQILSRFHFALMPKGYLLLGQVEMPLDHGQLFRPANLEQRLFQKVPACLRASASPRLQVDAQPTEQLSRQLRLQELTMDTLPIAAILLDAQGYVLRLNQQARNWFGFTAADVGRQLPELVLPYQPLQLQALWQHVQQTGRPLSGQQVKRQPGDRQTGNGPQTLELQVNPLFEQGACIGISFTFTDISAQQQLQTQIQELQLRLETTQSRLQAATKELETTNEQLQATNEELETTNAELRVGNLELQLLNLQLRESEQRLNAVLNSATTIAITRFRVLPNRDWEYLYLSPGCEVLLGYSVAELQANPRRWLSRIITPEAQNLVDLLQENIAAGRTFGQEYRFRQKDGAIRWLTTVYHSFSKPEGQGWLVTAVTTDISERKASELEMQSRLQEKTVLLQEIHHRVKNNLQVIRSLLSIQSDQVGDAATRAALEDAQNRVTAMALVHQDLYQYGNFAQINLATYVYSLAENLFASLETYPNRIALTVQSGADVPIALREAVPCGLILNELLTNAIKHGFQAGEISGTITVSLQRHGPELELAVSNTGLPLPADFDFLRCESMGMKLLQILSGQLGGQVTVSAEPETRFSLTFVPSQTVPNQTVLSETNPGETDP